MTGDDTMTAGAGHMVAHLAQSQGAVSSDMTTSAGYTQIVFSNGQTLLLKGVTVDFAGGGHQPT